MSEPDYFATLGLTPSADLSADTVRAAFHEKSRQCHPDSGSSPDAEVFERANTAQATLVEPASRLRHLVELRFGRGKDDRGGAIAPDLMDLFSSVGEAVQKADALARKKREARSELARALLEREVVSAQQRLTGGIADVDQAMAALTGGLADLDDLLEKDPAAAELRLRKVQRELVFLTKWKAQLREKFAGLF